MGISGVVTGHDVGKAVVKTGERITIAFPQREAALISWRLSCHLKIRHELS
jgi:hypothetical protein